MDTHTAAIRSLISGYNAFRHEHFEKTRHLYADLVKQGQRPKVLTIACCDSRVDPAIITGCAPGEMFVVRNVANLVPPFEGDHKHHGTSAALEYGVKSLKVSDIVIFGHSHCGGVRALIEGAPFESDFIADWMAIAAPAKEEVLAKHKDLSIDEKTHICGRKSLILSLKNLEIFPWIKGAVKEGKLNLHAWYFDLESGVIEAYTPGKGFSPFEA